MANGFTRPIKDNITFPEFAMRCARAFYALIYMCEDDLDAEIPDEIKPSEFYKENMEKAVF